MIRTKFLNSRREVYLVAKIHGTSLVYKAGNSLLQWSNAKEQIYKSNKDKIKDNFKFLFVCT